MRDFSQRKGVSLVRRAMREVGNGTLKMRDGNLNKRQRSSPHYQAVSGTKLLPGFCPFC